MRVLIVAKTRMGSGACIGAITETGESVRLIPFNADPHDGANREYEVGDIWNITAEPVAETSLVPPHIEDIVVREKHRIQAITNTKYLVGAIELLMPPKIGDPRALYEGLLQTTRSGSLYIAAQGEIPPYSTTFWRPDQPLTRYNKGEQIRYRYPTENGDVTFPFKGFEKPLETIPAGMLLRVSLARRFRPDNPAGKEGYYVQLSGWFLEEEIQEEQKPLHENGCRKVEIEQVDLTEPAQKFLSCIVRVEKSGTKVTFGKEYYIGTLKIENTCIPICLPAGTLYMIDILQGKKQEKIIENEHDKLSTWACGKEYRKEQWCYLVLQLLQYNLFEWNREDGSLHLTDKGRATNKRNISPDARFWGFPVDMITSNSDVGVTVELNT